MIPVQRPCVGPDELREVEKVFATRWLGLGATTREFEERIRELLGVKHVIAVNTGTSALHLALDAIGVGPGDEVVVPSLTFVASVQAILAVGARPVFCDIDSCTFNMDVRDALRRITPRTRAIMPVDYGGLPADIDQLRAALNGSSIRIVEDAAHSFGSFYRGRPVGSLSDVTCFSFDPIKNITTGEGGAITTDDDALAERIIPKRILGIENDTWSRYRNERSWFYEVREQGYRYHLSNVNAAIGLAQLKRLNEFRVHKQAIVRRYDEGFSRVPGLALLRHEYEESFPFFYVLRVLHGRRDDFIAQLKTRGIGTGVHWVPNHVQPLFANPEVLLPVTDQMFAEMVTLPLYFEMTSDEVERVIDAVTEFLE